MATRTRTAWNLRSDGQYDCRVGWKINGRGKREQHRFRIGGDLREAKRRDHLLRQMWDRIEQTCGNDSVWTIENLELAKQVAKGTTHLQVPRKPDEGVVPYAQRVNHLRHTFPMLALLPEPEYGSAFGVQILATLDKAFAEAELAVGTQQEADALAFRQQMSTHTESASVVAGPTLHEAMEEYSQWLEAEYRDPDSKLKPWGRTQIRQVGSLIAHHPDMPLSKVGHDEVEQMLRYWRQRPVRQGSTKRISKKSATHYVSALRNFFKWLHARPSYQWRKPEGFEDVKTQVVTLEADRRIQVRAEQIFSLDELKLLYRYGKPLDRLLILLGLNCGFGAAESASLLMTEIFLRTAHTDRQQEMLGTKISKSDSFIKRVRRKSGVYGEFLLFRGTVQWIEWAIRERRQSENASENDRLLLNSRGEAFDKPTAKGDPNRQIPNRFARLKMRIVDDNHHISPLPFKTLRKTGGDLVKRFSNGEISGVYLCHGRPVASDELSDAYTQRPFGKLFDTLRQVEDYLTPMFD